MKCPKCGSEKIQFGTSTSGGGFSFSNSCCGYIMLGPLGLLCGACGSGTSTEEFWICQDCGNKFSNREGKKQQAKEEASQKQKEINEEEAYQEYIKCKQLKEQAIEKYGSIQEINRLYYAAQGEKARTEKAYNAEFKEFIDNGDAKIKKINKRAENVISDTMTNIIAISFVIAIVICFFGLFPLAIPIIVLDVILFLNTVIKNASATTKIKKMFFKSNPNAIDLYENMRQSEKEFEALEALRQVIKYVDDYEWKNKK